ncbi:MAG: 3-deoxy-D-manno-octulosonic acid transferase [Elusimicrobiota bacterium]
MLLIYNILVGFAFVFVLPYFVWRYKLAAFDKIAIGIKQRLGFYDIEKGKYILFHASSVGELKTITLFITKLKKMFPEKQILILTMTPYGYKYAVDKKIADKVIFAPIDIPFCVEKLFLKVIPEMLVLIESELWPNLVFSAKRKGAKIVSINARMSDKSFRRYLFVKEFITEILKKIDFICAREESDRKKFIALGYDETKVIKTGNMKYDIKSEAYQRMQLPGVRKTGFGFKDTDLIFVTGSTREKEEEIVINLYKKLIPQFNNLKLVVAPRYPERCLEIEKILQKENLSFFRKTQLSTINYQPSTINCLLLDTIGELLDFYGIADIVFVGGSLFDESGGHNILEPAELGKPVIFGKYIRNFQESANALLSNHAAFLINNTQEFYETVLKLLTDQKLRIETGKKARETVVAQRGATDRNIRIVSEMLENA